MLIVFPRFDSSTDDRRTSRHGCTSVAPVEALTRLMRLTLGGEPVDVETFRTLERLVRDVAAYDLAYTDSIEAAAHLVDTLGGRGRADSARTPGRQDPGLGLRQEFLKNSSGMPMSRCVQMALTVVPALYR